MEIIEFRFLQTSDPLDKKYQAWSRIYEYPYALRRLRELGAKEDSYMHNTCWGFEGVHIDFKNDLDANYRNVLHTDIRPSTLPKTALYDIRYPAPEGFNGAFDFVINISTIEEVIYSHVEIIKNLLKQVKVGGYFIMTFDWSPQLPEGHGSLNLESVSRFIGRNIDRPTGEMINGENSAEPCDKWKHLNCGVLVIRKTA